MFTETTSYRPRNGQAAEAYWRVRLWCFDNGFSFSDVLNAIMIPVSFHLANHCKINKEKNYAMVDLTIGEVPILHVFQGKMYPLRADVDGSKDHLDREAIIQRIQHWEERNEDNQNSIDQFLKNVVHTS